MIASIQTVEIGLWADLGQDYASISWTDSRGTKGCTTGALPSEHLGALIARAHREGASIVDTRYPTARDKVREEIANDGGEGWS